MSAKKVFTREQAAEIATKLGVDFKSVKFDLEQFRHGMDIELEHGTVNSVTNVTNDGPLESGQITLAHLNEFPDYYVRLDELEKTADEYWQDKSKTKV